MAKFEQPPGTSQIAISNRKRRSLLFQQANGRCFYCGDPVFERECEHPRDWLMIRADRDTRMVREHNVPTIRGGSDGPENIVCACRTCNGLKGAFTADEFRLLMALRRGDLNFRFPGEVPLGGLQRDWIICHSDARFQRDLVVHNMPSAQIAYDMRNAVARGPKARRIKSVGVE